MTREEASKIIKDGIDDMSLDFADEEQYEALNMAIKALEQEPSVEFVKTEESNDNGTKYLNINVSDDEVKRNPDIVRLCSDVGMLEYMKPKTGHWIEHDWEDMREKGYYRCSVCGTGYQRFVKGIRKSDVPYIDGQEYTLQNIDNYCPNCGAKMESEDK